MYLISLAKYEVEQYLTYKGSRLCVIIDNHNLSLIGCKPGSMSILPIEWLLDKFLKKF